ncbi:DNA methyltransferase [Lentibacillus kapialis]|uniref:site-specific DNA-methyltransferase (adenine-specific) n=1 Tax=Lentibacillus kapialis TaxID=340214 RepID=A0A917PZ05_9BACI|nr:type ISP restriction/modification enzyme [Lentibacillus kapialis]GGK00702.1 DNA methyltransferase [Lentibacillus kapialis]
MKVFNNYLNELNKNLQLNNATEHTHRTALKIMIETINEEIIATNEPKRSDFGAPDFIITQGQHSIGYVEAKDIGENLDDVEQSEQLTRYLTSLDNLILTNYLEFRWYVQGEFRYSAKIGKFNRNGKIEIVTHEYKKLKDLLESFFALETPKVTSSELLASRMAGYSKLIHDIIKEIFRSENQSDASSIHKQLEAFREILINTLNPDEFADMYAQTICYGLFASRFNFKKSVNDEPFTRMNAVYSIPKTNPFLRKMFNHVAGPELDERIAWVVDDLVKMFRETDITQILNDFGNNSGKFDPVLHFYETFLASYDEKLREVRGVYYTPESVVSYIVESVDTVLKSSFDLADGLADTSKVRVNKIESEKGKRKTEDVHRVQILDPATGTGTFLHSVINKIYKYYENNKGMWSGYVSEHLLPRLHGFEILMASYAVTHMKLSLLLQELGYKFESPERLQVYLTNTLEKPNEIAGTNLFTHWLAEESNSASKIKTHNPVMVIVGNPPYSVNSVNTGEWIIKLLKGEDTYSAKAIDQTFKSPEKLISNYFKVEGKSLGEANPKNLLDDYVKFIRFSQWKIERTGYGVLGLITNHGYLNNPTFRGMRESLLKTFDDIYIINLHGNSSRKETSPDGTVDQNVFDIKQGVSIAIFVKKQYSQKQHGTVYYKDLWGRRQEKYEWLNKNNISSTNWDNVLKPSSPHYLFTPQDLKKEKEYLNGYKLDDIMPVKVTGIKTHRDSLVFGFTEEELHRKISDFMNPNISDDETRFKFFGTTAKGNNLAGDNSEWKMAQKRKTIYKDDNWKNVIEECDLKPYDKRYIFYHNDAIDRPKRKIMSNMLRTNLALVTVRQVAEDEFNHVFATDSMINNRYTLSNRGTAFMFPLYIYPTKEEIENNLFTEDHKDANFTEKFVNEISNALNLKYISDGKGDLQRTIGPMDFYNYIYAILNSNLYRERYVSFLKTDYPRIQFSSNISLFKSLRDLGEQLMKNHVEVDGEITTSFPVAGDNIVKEVNFESTNEHLGKLFINKCQYFDNVPIDVWNYWVGGYQISSRWLKDRVGRKLSFNELEYFQKMVGSIVKTINLTQEIDQVLKVYGGLPIKM